MSNTLTSEVEVLAVGSLLLTLCYIGNASSISTDYNARTLSLNGCPVLVPTASF